MRRLASTLIDRAKSLVTGWFAAPKQPDQQPRPIVDQERPSPSSEALPPSPAFVSSQPNPAQPKSNPPKPTPPPFQRQAPKAQDRATMQRDAVRNVRAKLEHFLASLEGLEDEALIRAIHHFETYGYSTVTGVPRIDIRLRRDHYDQAHLMAMKAFIEAKCAILLRICDREELQLELVHPSNLIGASLDEIKPATSGQVQAMVSDLTKEINHMTRSLVQNMDSRLLA